MTWTQRLETDDIELDELKNIISSMETNGDLQEVTLELISDRPITVTQDLSEVDDSAGSEQPMNAESGSGSEIEIETTHTESESDSSLELDPNPAVGESNRDGSSGPSHSDDDSTDSDTSNTTTKYSVDGQSGAVQSTSTHESSSDEVDDSAESEQQTPERMAATVSDEISTRKWPRLDQELNVDHELPLSAAAYPAEAVEFSGDTSEDVEHDTVYYARVNGRKEYGIFVTLTGSGYSPHSKSHEVTGLVHRSNILDRGPLNYAQGEELTVDLISHTEKGLSFRELPLLSTDEAKQARHSEMLRLNKLGIEPGSEVMFSKWPDDHEQTGTVLDINWGNETPPRPPSVKVEPDSESGPMAVEVRPSEIIAQVTPSSQTSTQPVRQTDSGTSQPTSPQSAGGSRGLTTSPNELSLPDASDSTESSDAGAPTTADTDSTSDVEQADSSRGTSAAAEVVLESDEVETEEEDEEPEEDVLECPCGRDDFTSKQALWGHQSSCEAYKRHKAEHEEPPAEEEASAVDSSSGRVLNPVVLEIRNDYAKVAAAMRLMEEETLRVRDLASALSGTDWDMGKSTINTHLSTLRDKGAATREKDGVYHYSLTDRGAAGVEQMLADVADEEIPDV